MQCLGAIFVNLFVSGVWNRRGNVHFTLESGARYELVEGDIRRAFSKYGKVRHVKLYARARRGLDGHVGKYINYKHQFIF